jgi:hypothetical protein
MLLLSALAKVAAPVGFPRVIVFSLLLLSIEGVLAIFGQSSSLLV